MKLFIRNYLKQEEEALSKLGILIKREAQGFYSNVRPGV
jgi:hypothetical protein